MQPNEYPAEQEAERNTACRDEDELCARLEKRESAGERGSNGELVDHEPRGIVHQALAFQHGVDPPRHVELREDGGRATASGGETIAPNANAAAHGMSGTRSLSAAPTASVVTTTRPIASRLIGRRLALKSRHEVRSAAW